LYYAVAQSLAMIFEEQPDALELTNLFVDFPDRARADNLIVISHHEKNSIVIEIGLLNIVHIMHLMSFLIERNRFFKRTCILEELMSNTIDQVFGEGNFVWFDASYVDHISNFPAEHYNHLTLPHDHTQ
jgi:hypothetical protein